MKYLRLFQTVAEKQAATLDYPNVNYTIENDSLEIIAEDPTPAFGGLTVKYNITQAETQYEVSLFNGGGGSCESESGGALPTTMIVDGVEETPINTWRFETAGEHIVQYTFEDNTVPQSFIDGNVGAATEAIVGTDITGIGSQAFDKSLTSATCLSTTPPAIGDSSSFGGDYSIYVPAESLETYKTATHWSNLASRIFAIQ